MRLRLLYKLFCGLPFHPRHPFAPSKAWKSSLQTQQYWLVHKVSSLALSPLLLQANPSPAAKLTTECLLCTVCSNTSRLCCSLKWGPRKSKHRNASAAQCSSPADDSGLQGAPHLQRDHTHTHHLSYQQANAKTQPQGTAKYNCLIAPSSLD